MLIHEFLLPSLTPCDAQYTTFLFTYSSNSHDSKQPALAQHFRWQIKGADIYDWREREPFNVALWVSFQVKQDMRVFAFYATYPQAGLCLERRVLWVCFGGEQVQGLCLRGETVLWSWYVPGALLAEGAEVVAEDKIAHIIASTVMVSAVTVSAVSVSAVLVVMAASVSKSFGRFCFYGDFCSYHSIGCYGGFGIKVVVATTVVR